MFVVLLEFTDKRTEAAQYMEGHKTWLQQGFDDDVFLLSGGLSAGGGGGILAHRVLLAALQERVAHDPFVAQGIVRAQIIEISHSRVDERLSFLVG